MRPSSKRTNIIRANSSQHLQRYIHIYTINAAAADLTRKTIYSRRGKIKGNSYVKNIFSVVCSYICNRYIYACMVLLQLDIYIQPCIYRYYMYSPSSMMFDDHLYNRFLCLGPATKGYTTREKIIDVLYKTKEKFRAFVQNIKDTY